MRKCLLANLTSHAQGVTFTDIYLSLPKFLGFDRSVAGPEEVFRLSKRGDRQRGGEEPHVPATEGAQLLSYSQRPPQVGKFY